MQFPILTSILAIPVIGAIVLIFLRDDEGNAATIRSVTLIVSGPGFALTLLLWNRFDPASAEFQFTEHHPWIPAFGIAYDIGVDGISLFLVVLTAFLTPLALLASWESVHRRLKGFCIFLLLLETAMVGVFVSL